MFFSNQFAPFGDENCGGSASCGTGLPASHPDFSRDRSNRCAVQLDDGVVQRHPVCMVNYGPRAIFAYKKSWHMCQLILVMDVNGM